MMKARMRFPGRVLGAMLIGLTLVVATGGFSSAQPAGGGSKGSLTIGSKNFAGNQVLGQVYGQALAKDGYDISYKENLGPTEVVFGALESGDLDLYPDYLNTVVQFLGGTGGPELNQVRIDELNSLLQGKGIVATKPAPSVDVNGFYVLKKTADKYKLKNVSDLKKVEGRLTLGAPPECEQRPLCLGDTSQQVYGLQFKEVKKLDTGGPVTVKALEDGDIQVAILFTGSSVIPKGAVLLKDDKGLQGADNPLVLVREQKNTPALDKAIDKVSAKITTAKYRKMTLAVTAKKEDPADVAKQFLKDNKLS